MLDGSDVYFVLTELIKLGIYKLAAYIYYNYYTIIIYIKQKYLMLIDYNYVKSKLSQDSCDIDLYTGKIVLFLWLVTNRPPFFVCVFF